MMISWSHKDKKISAHIEDSAAYLENEKGERVDFKDAAELVSEIYILVENLFNSRKGR